MNAALLRSVVFAIAGLTGVPQLMAQPADPQAAVVLGQLQPPSPAVPILRANAEGSQIYACVAKSSGGFEWTFKAPEAVLTDTAGKPVAKHFAGPTWQANDGSKVVGEVVANVGAPGGVAWLLLKAKSHEGEGAFAAVSYIQRIGTVGGFAPAAGCDTGRIGQEQRVPYTAVYVFYK